MMKKIKLRSSDKEIFEVEETLILQSQTIKLLIQDNNCGNNVIDLENVNSSTLAMVIEYCNKHSSTDDDLKTWDNNFVKVDKKILFDIILAAKYLDIKNLFELSCKTVADMIRGKTPEEIRKMTLLLRKKR